MNELELSIMTENPEVVASLESALDDFNARQKATVEISSLLWTTGRSHLVNYALFHSGPDASEIGSTWLNNFVSMDALHPFTPNEIRRMDSPNAFLPALWQSAQMGDQVWAIPWVADARNVYYRRDLLQEAGIDEAEAFASYEALAKTLETLAKNGVAQPWTMPTNAAFDSLHLLAPWVWRRGGNFMSGDGRRPTFTEDDALAGIRDYLVTFLPYLRDPDWRRLTDVENAARFRNGDAAVTIGGHWILNLILAGDAAPAVQKQLGVAVPPGTPFVGGSHLIIWNHSHRERETVALVEYLTSYPVQAQHIQGTGLLPARRDVLNEPPYTPSPRWRAVRQSLETGRSFKAQYLWGMVEDRLTTVIGAIWQELFADPEQDVEKVIRRRLEPVARKLERAFTN